MSTRIILVCFSIGAILTAQTRKHDVPLKNWPAPLYWQPSQAESEAARANLDPAIRPPSPEAATPAGSLVFVAMTPCRVVDTRSSCTANPALCSNVQFGPPSLSPFPAIRTFPIQLSPTCSIPSSAQAYSFNVTLIPNPLGTGVGYLTLCPTAPSPNTPPTAVTLDDFPTGDIRNNAAIVPAGISNGSVSAVTNGTGPDLVVDINGYFAPSTGITLAQGTAAAPSLSFSGDAGTGLFSSGAGALNFSSAGTNRMTLRSDGDLDLPGSIRKGGTLFLHNLGTRNTGLGLGALSAVTSGTDNTVSGFGALPSNTTGNNNTVYGSQALGGSPIGNNNTAVGTAAGVNGDGNTSVGAIAGNSGINNTSIGLNAGISTTGNNNTALGALAGINIAAGSNNIDIGHGGTSTDSGIIRIGTSGTQTSFFAAGISGVIAPSGVEVFIGTGGQLGTVQSSRRYKEDIQDMNDASSGLLRLRPVTYRYQQPYPDGSKPIDYGLIAEEVAEVYPDLVVKGDDGQVQTVQYHKLVPMLLNELQKEHAEVAALRKALETVMAGQAQPR